MEQFCRDGFVEGDDLELVPFGAGVLKLEGKIRCVGGLVVTVRKLLEIVGSVSEADALAENAPVQTFSYSYNVSIEGGHSVFRYDNAHPHPGHPDAHHRHEFDKAGSALPLQWVGEARWPTLGQVIAEARSWYWAHRDEL